jgi:aarF domain-containing kinase
MYGLQLFENEEKKQENLPIFSLLLFILFFFFLQKIAGNMMRTTDGKLAILDFGLMTEVTDDQKYGMIEAIAHLLNRDYTEIGQDFINLDFIPKGTDTRPIVPALTKVFDVALAGGGAKSINFQELSSDLAQITFDYPFTIPPYFALVIRAISVLEGIALVGNPNFAIIDEAYPYIARRLMTDQSPRLKATLRYMVYGRTGDDFDANRLIDLLQAMEKFVAIRDDGDGSAYKVNGLRGNRYVGKAGDYRGSQLVDISDRQQMRIQQQGMVSEEEGRFRVTMRMMNSAEDNDISSSLLQQKEADDRDKRTVREALRFFFCPEGQVFREFMLEEVVTMVDATSREAIEEIIRSTWGGRDRIPSLFRALSPQLSPREQHVVKQLRKLIQFLFGGELDDATNNDRLRKVLPVFREYAPQLREFGGLLVVRLSEKSLSRGINWALSTTAAITGRASAVR